MITIPRPPNKEDRQECLSTIDPDTGYHMLELITHGYVFHMKPVIQDIRVDIAITVPSVPDFKFILDMELYQAFTLPNLCDYLMIQLSDFINRRGAVSVKTESGWIILERDGTKFVLDRIDADPFGTGFMKALVVSPQFPSFRCWVMVNLTTPVNVAVSFHFLLSTAQQGETK